MSGEAARWRERRANYISLGFHPRVAGDLALQWLDGGSPESVTEAAEGKGPQKAPTPRVQRGRTRGAPTPHPTEKEQ